MKTVNKITVFSFLLMLMVVDVNTLTYADDTVGVVIECLDEYGNKIIEDKYMFVDKDETDIYPTDVVVDGYTLVSTFPDVIESVSDSNRFTMIFTEDEAEDEIVPLDSSSDEPLNEPDGTNHIIVDIVTPDIVLKEYAVKEMLDGNAQYVITLPAEDRYVFESMVGDNATIMDSEDSSYLIVRPEDINKDIHITLNYGRLNEPTTLSVVIALDGKVVIDDYDTAEIIDGVALYTAPDFLGCEIGSVTIDNGTATVGGDNVLVKTDGSTDAVLLINYKSVKDDVVMYTEEETDDDIDLIYEDVRSTLETAIGESSSEVSRVPVQIQYIDDDDVVVETTMTYVIDGELKIDEPLNGLAVATVRDGVTVMVEPSRFTVTVDGLVTVDDNVLNSTEGLVVYAHLNEQGIVTDTNTDTSNSGDIVFSNTGTATSGESVVVDTSDSGNGSGGNGTPGNPKTSDASTFKITMLTGFIGLAVLLCKHKTLTNTL